MPSEPSIAVSPRLTTPVFETAAGPVPYPDALTRMAARTAAIRAGTAGELVWLLEHPPLYTAGTSAKPADLIGAPRFPTFRTSRGGQWTYHGPGQRVVYPMLDLSRRHGTVRPRDVRAYVEGIEEWVARALARFAIKAERRDGRIGLWVVHDGSEAKIAALGVHVSHWITSHGIAINVAPDLTHFSGIVPCGIRGYGVTSLAALGSKASLADLDAALLATWEGVFGGA